jgi:predicted MFS family arabinose efflux permease
MSRTALVVLVCGSAVISISMGLRQVMGLFLTPITMDLGISREAFGFAVGLQSLMWGLTQPFAGLVADRHGARGVIAVTAMVYVAGLVLAGASSDALLLCTAIGVLAGIGQSGTGFAVVLGAVGRATPRESRSIVLGIASAAGSIGMFTFVPAAQALLGALDWRGALVVLAAVGLLMLPLALGVRDTAPRSHVAALPFAVVLRQAARSPSYWMLNAGFAACGFQLAFVATFLPSMLSDAALPPMTAAWVLATIGLANIVGTYLCGLLGARFRKPSVLAAIYVARAAIMAAFLLTPLSVASALLFGAALGLIWAGTVPLSSGLVADIFGERHMGFLFGVVYVGHQLGSFLGAWIGGRIHDQTGSYDAVWIAAIVLGLVAALLHWPIDDRPAAQVAAAR